MELIEITIEDIIKNMEKYCKNNQQFFIKTNYQKWWRSARLYRIETWNYNIEQPLLFYKFKYDNGQLDDIDAKHIEHIYIIK